jgi:hypothetical protein
VGHAVEGNMNDLQPKAEDIVARHAAWTAGWHEAATALSSSGFWAALERNHRMNFELWHEEDLARRDDLGADRVRQAKRAIDRCNQARNDAVEEMDSGLMRLWPVAAADRPLHSETPGMIIDRLSILSLKLYHTRIEAERASASDDHRAKCQERCRILQEQRGDLQQCLEVLLGQLQRGERRFKLYRQLKMYNDATLNPQLYAAAAPSPAPAR